MTRNISRRSLARGAAWSAPVVLAASAVPARAASHVIYSYAVNASWYASYEVYNDGYCDDDEGLLQSVTFTMHHPVDENPYGFAIVNDEASTGTTSPTAQATLSDWKVQVAFPEGFTDGISIDSGDYSGPVWSSGTIDGQSVDIYAFTFTGDTTASTVDQGTSSRTSSWDDSVLETTVDAYTEDEGNRTCYPSSGVPYWFHIDGTFTTANGYSGSAPSDWSRIDMGESD